jgi:hypothetical protein
VIQKKKKKNEIFIHGDRRLLLEKEYVHVLLTTQAIRIFIQEEEMENNDQELEKTSDKNGKFAHPLPTNAAILDSLVALLTQNSLDLYSPWLWLLSAMEVLRPPATSRSAIPFSSLLPLPLV